MHKFLFTIVLSIATLLSTAQPFIGYFLGYTYESSKGGTFLQIEETYELTLKDITTLPYRTEKRFNSQGNITSEVVYGKTGGKSSETRWEYLNGTKLTLKHHKYFVNMIGWQEESLKIEYDPITDLPKSIMLDKNGKPFQWAIVVPDTLNRIESVKVFDARKAHIFTENLMYLDASNMIKVMVYRANGQFFGTWSYRLNERKQYNFSTLKIKYNDNGDIMLETLSNAVKGDQAYYYEYQYDSHRNWIVKETYQVSLGSGDKIRKKKLEHKVTRKITYQ